MKTASTTRGDGPGQPDLDRDATTTSRSAARASSASACRTDAPPIPATAPSTSTRKASSSPATATSSIPASPCRRPPRASPISAAGQVQATIPGQTTPQDLGQIQLARFVNKTGLESIGDNLFLETAASGPAIDGNPGAEGFGNLQQSYLEEANVNAVTEISSLIAAQRAYEMNAKVVTAADQMLSSSTQMIRG